MSGFSPFMWLLYVWGAVTTVFVILMIYRSLFSMREDDQLFLNPQEVASGSRADGDSPSHRPRDSVHQGIRFGLRCAGGGESQESGSIEDLRSSTRLRMRTGLRIVQAGRQDGR